MFVITINQFLLHVLSVPLLSCRGYIVERRSEWRRDAAHGWPLLAPSWSPPPRHCTRHISIFSLSTATTWWRLLLSSTGCKTQWAAACHVAPCSVLRWIRHVPLHQQSPLRPPCGPSLLLSSRTQTQRLLIAWRCTVDSRAGNEGPRSFAITERAPIRLAEDWLV